MKSSRSDSIALALLAILLVALVCLVRTEAPPQPRVELELLSSDPPPSTQQSRIETIKELEAKIAQLTAKKEALQAELLEPSSSLALPSPRVSLEDLSSGAVVFAGLVERAKDGTPNMIATWKGRLPSDFGDYIDHAGSGPWLIGRIGNNIRRERDSTRFCYEVTPEGKVVGIALNSRVELELPPENAIGEPDAPYSLKFKAATLCPPMELAELRKQIEVSAPRE